MAGNYVGSLTDTFNFHPTGFGWWGFFLFAARALACRRSAPPYVGGL